MAAKNAIIWFRRDFRLDDHPALHYALEQGLNIIPVYIHAPEEEAPWKPGEASNWWRHNSLLRLEESLKDVGSRLIVRQGKSLDELQKLIKETGAEVVHWNRLYEPAIVEHDIEIKSALKDQGLEVKSFNGALLHEPWEVEKNTGGPYKVFTPYWRQVTNELRVRDPWPAPEKLPHQHKWPDSVPIGDLDLFPKLDWWKGLDAAWTPGESTALERLDQFLDEIVSNYGDDRNRPDRDGTSRMSPHLHFGEISPQRIWKVTHDKFSDKDKLPSGAWKFLAEVGWREFAHHLLYHFPHMTEKPLNEKFEKFPWEDNEEGLEAWQDGNTGFPIVDAGMRQLYETGWMHNRVRMIVGSFLVKDLRVHWSEGARWFWDTLVDASLASNTMGWQWVAGCGADAAPYFRVFNPMTQGEKFDPKGEYTRQYCPELDSVPDKYLQQPWEADGDLASEANITLGKDYPEPIVDHKEERLKALEAYECVKVKK